MSAVRMLSGSPCLRRTAAYWPSPGTYPGSRAYPCSVRVTGGKSPQSRMSAPSSAAIQATVPSFSCRLKVQVEYRRMPPGLRADQTSERMRRLRAAQNATVSGDQSSTAFSSLRNMPSPEQGTSATTISKTGFPEKADGSRETTPTRGSPQVRTFERSTPKRFRITSLARREKRSPKRSRSEAARSVVLPPGAAQRSRTVTPGPKPSSTERNSPPTNMADESCT